MAAQLRNLMDPWVASVNMPPAPTPPPPGRVGRGSIADLANAADPDKITVARVGVYSGGTINRRRPATPGRFKGYAVVVAERRGECFIDQSAPGTPIVTGLTANGDLVFESEDCRVLLVGFTPINGTVRLRGYESILWYPDASYTAEMWAKEAGHPDSQYHHAPRTLQLEYGNVSCRVYGADLHHTGTAIAMFPGSRMPLIQGAHLTVLGDGGGVLDPLDVVHPDAIGAVGGNQLGIEVFDSFVDLNGSAIGMMFETSADGKTGGEVTLDMQRVWVRGAGGAGVILASTTKFPMRARLSDVRVFDNGREHGGDDVWNFTYFVDGKQTIVRRGEPIPSLAGSMELTCVNVTIGVAPPAGAVDPATTWRSQHPYESWEDTIFGSVNPSPVPVPTPTPVPVPVPVPTPLPIPPPPAIHPPDDDIRSTIERPGGVVIVKAGQYKVGSPGWLKAVHDTPLVLVAEERGQCAVDMSRAALVLLAGSTNLKFVGFKFHDGMFVYNGSGLDLCYTDHSFPIEVWDQQYKSYGGNRDALLRMPNGVPKAVWLGQNTEGQVMTKNRLLGVDIHDVGDDGLFGGMQQSPIVEGTRIWNVDEKALDPLINPWVPGMGDLFHNDAVQLPGDVGDLQLRWSYTQGTLQLVAENGNMSATISDCWLAGNGGLAIITGAHESKQFRALISLKNVRAFSNGMAFRRDDGWNHMLTEMIGTRMTYWPDSLHDQRVVVTDLGGNTDRDIPADIPRDGMYMRDKLAPLDNPANPALQWRKRNPYENWRQLLGV